MAVSKEIETKTEISILMVASDPSREQNLKLQTEERAIRKAFEKAKRVGNIKIEFDVLPAASLNDLADQLLNRKSIYGKTYDVVHFSGHCSVQQHMIRLVLTELGRQHGTDVLQRTKRCQESLKKIHDLANQVTKYLELLSTRYMDTFKYEAENTSNAEQAEYKETIDNNMNNFSSSKIPNLYKKYLTTDSNKYLQKTEPKTNGNINEDKILDINNYETPQDETESNNDRSLEDQKLILRIPCIDTKNGEIIVDADPISGLVPTLDIILHKKQIIDSGVGSLAFETHNDGVIHQYSSTSKTPHFVNARSFAKLLSPYVLDGLGCILFNACNSVLISEQILSTGVPLSICCPGQLSDADALRFSTGFYEALAHGNTIERSFIEGENRIAAYQRLVCNNTNQSISSTPLPSAAKKTDTASNSHDNILKSYDRKMVLMRANGSMILKPTLVRDYKLVLEENEKMKKIFEEGVELLNEKDKEIELLKKKLALMEKKLNMNKTVEKTKINSKVKLKRPTSHKIKIGSRCSSFDPTSRKKENRQLNLSSSEVTNNENNLNNKTVSSIPLNVKQKQKLNGHISLNNKLNSTCAPSTNNNNKTNEKLEPIKRKILSKIPINSTTISNHNNWTTYKESYDESKKENVNVYGGPHYLTPTSSSIAASAAAQMGTSLNDSSNSNTSINNGFGSCVPRFKTQDRSIFANPVQFAKVFQ